MVDEVVINGPLYQDDQTEDFSNETRKLHVLKIEVLLNIMKFLPIITLNSYHGMRSLH